MTLNAVVLPAPFGPIRPEICPDSTSNETPSRATMPPKRNVISRTDSNVATASGSLLARTDVGKPFGPRQGSRGAQSAARPIAPASRAAATATNDAVTSRGFDVRRDDATQPVVDGAEPLGIGRLERRAPGRLRDARERRPVGRHRDGDLGRLPGRPSPCRERAERDRVDRHTRLPREARSVVRLQHSRASGRRRRGARPRRGARGSAGRASELSPVDERTSSTARATASPIAVPKPGASDCDSVLQRSPVGRRRSEDDRVVGERDEADPDPLRHVVGERGNRRRAASSRLGATSVAFIEIETSTTSTTVARSGSSRGACAGGRPRRRGARPRRAAARRSGGGPARTAGDPGEHREVRE